jgi:tetratricopeptide (TPR) repeat protein
MGTVRISDKLYNQGLERLKADDFFHATAALNKSVAINKNNVPARNLLGIALFEVGHVGEALKHWVISQSMLKEDNAATKYIETVHKNARQLERLNDAVGMYNQALGHIKQKSDDLAIIQLKKAVEINPRFIDALNLLTLCYLIDNDRERAIATMERVLAIDAFNPIALNYCALLNPGKKTPRLSTGKQKTSPSIKSPYKPLGLEEKKQKNFHLAELFTFLIGVIITFGACYFLLIPAIERSNAADLTQVRQELEGVRAEHIEELARLENDKLEQEQEIASMREEKQHLSHRLDIEQRVNTVNRAFSRYADNELRDAVNLLDGFNRSALPPDILQRIDTILENAYPRLGVEYYNLGLASFNPPRDSHMALQHLEKAHRFLSEDATQWNRMLFMLGTLYYDDGARMEDALEILTALDERTPGTGLSSPFTGAERTLFANMMSGLDSLR